MAYWWSIDVDGRPLAELDRTDAGSETGTALNSFVVLLPMR